MIRRWHYTAPLPPKNGDGRRTNVGSLRGTRVDSDDDAALEDKGEGGSSVQHFDGLGLGLLERIGEDGGGLGK